MRQLRLPDSQMLKPRQGTSTVIVSSQLAGFWFGVGMVEKHIYKPCEYCGKGFGGRYIYANRRFCSRQCASKKKKRLAIERFMEKTQKLPNGCIEWTGRRRPEGYGRFGDGEVRSAWKAYSAHRWIWAYHNGPIPKGMQINHHCDNPPCVNLDHLYCGTQKDNIRDMMERKRHPYIR